MRYRRTRPRMMTLSTPDGLLGRMTKTEGWARGNAPVATLESQSDAKALMAWKMGGFPNINVRNLVPSPFRRVTPCERGYIGDAFCLCTRLSMTRFWVRCQCRRRQRKRVVSLFSTLWDNGAIGGESDDDVLRDKYQVFARFKDQVSARCPHFNWANNS